MNNIPIPVLLQPCSSLRSSAQEVSQTTERLHESREKLIINIFIFYSIPESLEV